jgi:hypothetical protein
MKSRFEKNANMFAVILLIIGCLLVLRPFILAILWAAILCFCTWPIYQRVEKSLKGRRTAAAAIMTLLIVLVIILPVGIIGISLARNVSETIKGVRKKFESESPITTVATFQTVLVQARPGTRVPFRILRAGKERHVEVSVPESPRKSGSPELQVQELTAENRRSQGLPENLQGVLVVRSSNSTEHGLLNGDIVLASSALWTPPEFLLKIPLLGKTIEQNWNEFARDQTTAVRVFPTTSKLAFHARARYRPSRCSTRSQRVYRLFLLSRWSQRNH